MPSFHYSELQCGQDVPEPDASGHRWERVNGEGYWICTKCTQTLENVPYINTDAKCSKGDCTG